MKKLLVMFITIILFSSCLSTSKPKPDSSQTKAQVGKDEPKVILINTIPKQKPKWVDSDFDDVQFKYVVGESDFAKTQEEAQIEATKITGKKLHEYLIYKFALPLFTTKDGAYYKLVSYSDETWQKLQEMLSLEIKSTFEKSMIEIIDTSEKYIEEYSNNTYKIYQLYKISKTGIQEYFMNINKTVAKKIRDMMNEEEDTIIKQNMDYFALELEKIVIKVQ